jgi:hypothetical protein
MSARLDPTAKDLRPVPPVLPDRTTTAQQALDRFHDERMGKVRRVSWPVDEDDQAGGVLHDFDPFA